jgi:hypothetical protein
LKETIRRTGLTSDTPIARWLAALLLLAINIAVCRRLFSVGYLPHFNSLEPFFFALADHIKSYWPHVGWYPCWYGGMPFEYTYQPLLPHLAAAVSLVTSWTTPHAFHFCVALFYACGPVALYLLVLGLSQRLDTAIFAALCYSLWSPSALLVPAIAQDIGGVWHARRLYNAVVYADSPQIAGLTMVPLVILAVHWAVRRPGVLSVIVTALALISVPLINIPATIGLAMALAAYFLALNRDRLTCVLVLAGSSFLALNRDRLTCALVMAGSSLLGYLLFCRWMPPSEFPLMLRNEQVTNPDLTPHRLLWSFAFILLVLAIAWGANRLRLSPVTRFAVLFSFITGAIALGEPWFHISLLQESPRFHVILEMAIAVLVGVGLSELAAVNRVTRIAVIVVVTVLAGIQFVHYRRFARQIINNANIAARSEYRVARWFDRNAGGRRVLAPGSIEFFLNSATRTPQMTGCCLQNALSMAEVYASYQYVTDDGAEPSKAAGINLQWLKALGVSFVVTDDAKSTEVYHDVRHPYKFDGVLPLRWRDDGDFIYEIPMPSASLAHAVLPDELVQRFPVNGIDVAPLGQYVTALDDPSRPVLKSDWLGTSELRVAGPVAANQIVSIQVSYHPGWRAKANGRDVPVAHDALGFIAVSPGRSGPCDLRLVFTGGREYTITKIISICTWISVLVALLFYARAIRLRRRLPR